MKTLALFAAWFAIVGTALAATPAPSAKTDVRIGVKATSSGSEHPNKGTTVSSRELQIHLENREHRQLAKLQLEWKIIGEDLNSDKKKVDASGKKAVTLEADGKLDVTSDVIHFTEKQGVPKTTGKGKSRRTTGQPDTGRRYAGYLVELKQDGKVIAEASTVGIRKQVPGL